MKLINQTKNTVIAEEVAVASSLPSRVKGLLGRSSMKPGEALIITACSSIHTFFMGFTIDVLFVNKEDVIVAAAQDIRPFRMRAALSASYVVELPAGTITPTQCSPGDKIKLQ